MYVFHEICHSPVKNPVNILAIRKAKTRIDIFASTEIGASRSSNLSCTLKRMIIIEMTRIMAMKSVKVNGLPI